MSSETRDSNNIHSSAAAAEAAEPNTAPAPPRTLKEEILALSEKRTATETNVRDALELLETTPVGMYEPLIDAEGFPRADCDLYAVRTARNTIICGRNDLREIEEALYEKLGELHESSKAEAEVQMAADAEARRQGKAEAEARQKRMIETQRVGKLAPLLTVASVEAGSPAADAGLLRGSSVLQYGPLNMENIREKGLASIAAVTQEYEGVMLSLWLREQPEAEPKELFIVPQTWSGRGLLGCALDPA